MSTAPRTQVTVTGTPRASISQPKPRMKHVQGSVYLVESSSQPGVGHKVDVLRLTCGCPAGRYGRRCHHLVWAIQMDAWRRGIQAQAARPAASGTPAPRVSSTGTHGTTALMEAFG